MLLPASFKTEAANACISIDRHALHSVSNKLAIQVNYKSVISIE